MSLFGLQSFSYQDLFNDTQIQMGSAGSPLQTVFTNASSDLITQPLLTNQIFLGQTGALPLATTPTFTVGPSLTKTSDWPTLSIDTIQDLRQTANATLASLTLTGLTTNALVYSNGSDLLSSVTIGAQSNGISLSLASGVLTGTAAQDLRSSASPQWANISVAAGGKLDTSSAGALTLGSTASSISLLAASTGSINVGNGLNTLYLGSTAALNSIVNIQIGSIGATNICTGSYAGTLSIGNSLATVKFPAFSTGLLHTNSSGVLSSSLCSLTADVSGILPISGGGTNSGAILGNGKLMVSSLGAIVEGTSSSSPVFTNITGILTSSSQPNITIAESQVTNLVTDLAACVQKAGSTMTGLLVLSGDATNALNPVTLQQFNTAVAGFTAKATCYASTTASLGWTYNNGASGVGATLTNSVFGAFSTDGVSPPLNSRILVQFEAVTSRNGIFVLSTVGDASHASVLTRATDYDTPGEMINGSYTLCEFGTLYQGSMFVMNTTVTTVGTDGVNWFQFNITLPGSNLSKTGNTINLINSPSVSGSLSASTGVYSAQTLTTAAGFGINWTSTGLSGGSVYATMTATSFGAITLHDSVSSRDVLTIAATTSAINTRAATLDDGSGNSTFNSVKATALTASRLVYSDTSSVLQSAAVSANLSFTSGTLDTAQGIQTSSSPTFAQLIDSGLTASTLLWGNASKQLASVSLGSVSNGASLSFSAGTLSVTNQQDISSSAAVTFANVIDSGLTASAMLWGNASKQLASVTLGSISNGCQLSFSGGTLSVTNQQDISSGASPTFANVTAGGYKGALLNKGFQSSVFASNTALAGNYPSYYGTYSDILSTGLSYTAAFDNSMQMASATINNGGSGYQVGDVVQVVDSNASSPATFTVNAAPGGVVTLVVVQNMGSHDEAKLPTTCSCTGGHGTGLVLNVFFGMTITSLGISSTGGSYAVGDRFTITGGTPIIQAIGVVTAIGTAGIVTACALLNHNSYSGQTATTTPTLAITGSGSGLQVIPHWGASMPFLNGGDTTGANGSTSLRLGYQSLGAYVMSNLLGINTPMTRTQWLAQESMHLDTGNWWVAPNGLAKGILLTSAGVLSSLHNTLDDSGGNMTINGNTNGPLLVTSTALGTGIFLQNNSVGVGSMGWTTVGMGMQNGNGDHILQQLTSSTTDKSLKTNHNTLDDGNGYMTISTANTSSNTPLNLNAPSSNGTYLGIEVAGASKVAYGYGTSGQGISIFDYVSNSFWLTQGGTTAHRVQTFNQVLDDGSGNMTVSGFLTGAGLYSRGYVVCKAVNGYWFNDGSGVGGSNYFHITSTSSGGLTFSDDISGLTVLSIATTTGNATFTGLVNANGGLSIAYSTAAAGETITQSTSGNASFAKFVNSISTRACFVGLDGTGLAGVDAGSCMISTDSTGAKNIYLNPGNTATPVVSVSSVGITTTKNYFMKTTVTTPSTGNQTITASEILGGIINAPVTSSSFTWTTDTGTAIYTAMGSPAVGTTVTCLWSNSNNSAGAVMSIGMGSGVTGQLRGATLNNNQSMLIYFRVTGTNTITCYS